MRDALEGLTVVDLSRLHPGPFATAILAGLGARVIRVEEPGVGDPARWFPPMVEGTGFLFSALNRSKESVAVNLKAPEGAELVRRLAARADVLVESFRPGVLERLDLAPDELLRANPRLVVLRISGFGQQGPRRDEAAHDLNYEALAGIVALTGPEERPVVPVAPVADLGGGLYGALAVLAALRERDRTGRGAVLDVALHDAALAATTPYLARAAAGLAPRRGDVELGGGLACYNLYRCADGAWLALGALEPKFWQRFCEAVGRPEWVPRHLDGELAGEAAELLARRSRDAWLALLRGADVPASPVLEPAEVLEDPHVRARLGGVPGPASPLTHLPLEGRVPALGEQTDEVLAELGYSVADVAKLREAGVVA